MSNSLRLMVLCAFLAGTLAAQDQKAQDHKGKPAPVDVIEMKARRADDIIEVTAHVKNTGEKPLKGLQIIFKFENNDGAPISTEEMKIDETRFMPGAESTLNVQLRDSPRATEILLGAETSGAEVTVANAGPYQIE
jgi:hypothetical protein